MTEERFNKDQLDEAVAREREACAVAAWSAGMDTHNKANGFPACDAREVGSLAARAIRMREEGKECSLHDYAYLLAAAHNILKAVVAAHADKEKGCRMTMVDLERARDLVNILNGKPGPPPAPTPSIDLIITVDGGLVQSVCTTSSTENLNVYLVDHDTDGADDQVFELEDGTARIVEFGAVPAPAYVEEVKGLLDTPSSSPKNTPAP